MVRLYDAQTGEPVGQIMEGDLQFLIDQLEETSESDQDYYIDEATLAMLADEGGDDRLIEVLRRGMAGREGYEVRWER